MSTPDVRMLAAAKLVELKAAGGIDDNGKDKPHRKIPNSLKLAPPNQSSDSLAASSSTGTSCSTTAGDPSSSMDKAYCGSRYSRDYSPPREHLSAFDRDRHANARRSSRSPSPVPRERRNRCRSQSRSRGRSRSRSRSRGRRRSRSPRRSHIHRHRSRSRSTSRSRSPSRNRSPNRNYRRDERYSSRKRSRSRSRTRDERSQDKTHSSHHSSTTRDRESKQRSYRSRELESSSRDYDQHRGRRGESPRDHDDYERERSRRDRKMDLNCHEDHHSGAQSASQSPCQNLMRMDSSSPSASNGAPEPKEASLPRKPNTTATIALETSKARNQHPETPLPAAKVNVSSKTKLPETPTFRSLTSPSNSHSPPSHNSPSLQSLHPSPFISSPHNKSRSVTKISSPNESVPSPKIPVAPVTTTSMGITNQPLQTHAKSLSVPSETCSLTEIFDFMCSSIDATKHRFETNPALSNTDDSAHTSTQIKEASPQPKQKHPTSIDKQSKPSLPLVLSPPPFRQICNEDISATSSMNDALALATPPARSEQCKEHANSTSVKPRSNTRTVTNMSPTSEKGKSLIVALQVALATLKEDISALQAELPAPFNTHGEFLDLVHFPQSLHPTSTKSSVWSTELDWIEGEGGPLVGGLIYQTLAIVLKRRLMLQSLASSRTRISPTSSLDESYSTHLQNVTMQVTTTFNRTSALLQQSTPPPPNMIRMIAFLAEHSFIADISRKLWERGLCLLDSCSLDARGIACFIDNHERFVITLEKALHAIANS